MLRLRQNSRPSSNEGGTTALTNAPTMPSTMHIWNLCEMQRAVAGSDGIRRNTAIRPRRLREHNRCQRSDGNEWCSRLRQRLKQAIANAARTVQARMEARTRRHDDEGRAMRYVQQFRRRHRLRSVPPSMSPTPQCDGRCGYKAMKGAMPMAITARPKPQQCRYWMTSTWT